MVIIYDRRNDGTWQFIRLEFDTGEYDIATVLNDFIAGVYILTYKEEGYTFIHR